MRKIVAVCVCAAVASVATPNASAKGNHPEAKADQAHSTPPIAINPSAVEPIQPSEYYQPCRQNSRNYRSDLCAQWTAAQGATDAAYWAYWSFWVGLVGLGGLLGTLIYTARGTRAAIDALDTQIAAERPLLQLSYFKIAPTKESTDENLCIRTEWKLTNFGRTGAWIEAAAIIVDDRHDELKLATADNEAAYNAFIAPKNALQHTGEDDKTEWRFHENETANVRSDKCAYVWGYSVYHDSGGRRWKTGFAGRIALDDSFAGDTFSPQAMDEHWFDVRVPSKRERWWNRLPGKLPNKVASTR